MTQYIDKDALVAEIERLRENQRLDDRHGQGVLDGLHAIEKFLNDLEVKEVEEPVSEDFEEACNQMSEAARISKCEAGKPFFSDGDYKLGFKAGANWQKQRDDEMLTVVYMDGVEKGKKMTRE